jgi:MFS family permease
MTTGDWGRRWPTSRDEDRCPTGIAIALGAAVLIGVAFISAAFPPAPAPRLALLVVAVALFAALSGDGPAALAVAGLAWPIGNGFLVNRYGGLSWHGRLDTGFVLSLLIAVSVGMVVSQGIVEWRADRRRMRPFEQLLHETAIAADDPESESANEVREALGPGA